jgi:hypothetical protein
MGQALTGLLLRAFGARGSRRRFARREGGRLASLGGGPSA